MPSAVPAILYHYTSIEAFHAIVTSRSFLATQIQYLNDAKEIRHALERACAIIAGRSEAIRASDDETLFSAMEGRLSSIGDARLFLIALSEEGDLLNQWRAYCPYGGVSLGLDTAAFAGLASEHAFLFEKCVYDPNDCDSRIEGVINESLARFRRRHSSENTAADADAFCDRSFYGQMLQTAAVIKHPAFSQEREWRAVGGPFPYDHPAAGWRPRGSQLLPFLRIGFEDLELGAVIKKVNVGPSPDQSLLYESIQGFLANEGWDGSAQADLIKSPIPYRTDWS